MGQENTVYRPPTGLRKALFFLITGIFTTLLIVAITLGYYGVKAYCFYEETCKNGGWEGDSCVRNDAEVGYVPTENTWSRHRVDPVFTICTDNRGGRVADHHMTAPAKVDALFIGCSFTWGHGVEEPDTYAQHLHCRTGYEVYNAGVASYGTTTALLSIKRYADLRPKLLVYGYIDHHKLRSISPSAFSSCPIVRPVPFVDFDA